MNHLLLIFLNLFASGNLVAEWGTIDTILLARGAIRVWVKLVNRDSIERALVPNELLIPHWYLTSERDSLQLPSSGYLGTFDNYIELRPFNGIFIYDLIDLFPISEKISATTATAKICIHGSSNIRFPNSCKQFPVEKVKNAHIESFMSKWDSIRHETIIKKQHKLDDARKQCDLMKQAWNQLSQNSQLIGDLVGAAYKIRLSACGEGNKPIPYPITPIWKEFESANLCIADLMIEGADRSAATAKCKSKILDLHAFTQKLAAAQTVIPFGDGVKFISNLDTLRLFPIDYWPVQQ